MCYGRNALKAYFGFFFSFFNFLKDVENYEMGANALEIFF